jgi:hypothetical protein
MTNIVLNERQLERRRLTLQSTFRDIARSNRVEVFYKYGTTTAVIGLGNENFGTDYRSARHPSRVENFFINYFEVWSIQSGGARFHLEKAYLHLLSPYSDGTGDEEILALHCDPTILPHEASYLYKRGPHLHISSRRKNFGKAHIALCLNELDNVCEDYGKFSSAFSEIIGMIDKEFLPNLQ